MKSLTKPLSLNAAVEVLFRWLAAFSVDRVLDPCSFVAHSLFHKKYSLFEGVGNFTLSQRNHCVNLARQTVNRDGIRKIPC